MQSILIVTSDMEHMRGLGSSLSRMGFTCTICNSVDDVLKQDSHQSFSAVLIDISTLSPGGYSPWKWFRKLKLKRLLPVLALVSTRNLQLVLQEQGFDDFIIQPWNMEELSARIHRVIARANKPAEDTIIKIGDLTIDPVRCEVGVANHILTLTFKEYELLKLLASNKGKVFTRETLLNEIWGYDYYGGDRTVDVHIRRLRSKIEDTQHSFIETVRNIGYRFKDPHLTK